MPVWQRFLNYAEGFLSDVMADLRPANENIRKRAKVFSYLKPQINQMNHCFCVQLPID